MSKKKAILKGKNQGELIRVKQTLRKQNEIIKNAKKKASDGGQSSPNVTSDLMKDTRGMANTASSSLRKFDDPDATKTASKFPSLVLDRPKVAMKNLEELKKGNDLIRFYIRQKFGADIPVNAKLESYQQGDDQHHKIEKYLKGRDKADEEGIFLARLYDDNLNEVVGLRYGDSMVDKHKLLQNETRSKITELLNVHNRYKK